MAAHGRSLASASTPQSLQGCQHVINLVSGGVTDAGVADLEKALPNLMILSSRIVHRNASDRNVRQHSTSQRGGPGTAAEVRHRAQAARSGHISTTQRYMHLDDSELEDAQDLIE
jgi:hypothetical protein